MLQEEKAKQYWIWGAAATLMRRHKGFVIAIYLSFGGIVLSLLLGLATGMHIFVWSFDLSMVVWGSIVVGGAIVNVREYFQRRNEREPQQ